MFYKYRLQAKQPYTMPNVLGNHSMPVHTYRWVDIAVSNSKEALEEMIIKLKEDNPKKAFRIEEFGFNGGE